MIIEEPEEMANDGPEEDQTNVRRAAAARKANKAHLTVAQGPEEFISLELTVAEERVAVKLQVTFGTARHGGWGRCARLRCNSSSRVQGKLMRITAKLVQPD